LVKSMREVGPAAALLLAVVVLFAVLMLVTGVVTFHRSGGCNFIPLVNGQPAYPCSSTPHG
jgi:hypothetical protein